MRTPIHEQHETDVHGNPSGGVTIGRGFTIAWQNGPLMVDGARREPTGAFVEDIIAAVIGRIEHYQASEFSCVENAEALDALRVAAARLNDRTMKRQTRGVEGTHTA